MNEGWETVYIFWKKEISMVQHFLTIGIILNLKKCWKLRQFKRENENIC